MLAFRLTSILLPLLALGTVAAADDDAAGKQLYQEFCVACHGAMAKGQGELAGLLTVKVPDLTTLARRHDGKFPMLDVIHIIDGRTGVRAHGGPMPLFGAMFESHSKDSERGYGSVLETRGRILTLALYLESIQE